MSETTVPRRFAALRDRHSRPYLFTAGLSMMGDNIEHVITYWVLWQEFHSPALVGFEVISHWLPFLLLSVWFGGLAEKYDCRRLVQIAQGLFMLVSVCWGVLFLTGTLQVWEACVLLVLHGCAGALWAPAEQMLLHDFAEPAELPGAVRLNATFRSLGVLAGPVVGSALLLGLGSTWGIFANVLFYLPMTLLMLRTPYTGHTRSGYVHRARLTLADGFRTIRQVGGDRVLVAMIVLAGLVALCVGGSLQVSIPSFADALGAGSAGFGYGLLLFANGAGGVLGGFLLEATGALKPNTKVVVVTTVLFGATTLAVAVTGSFVVAVVALFIGGIANMASTAIGQAVVQLRAPVEQRGRVVGVYNMFGSGMRTGNGITLAVLGAAVGVGSAVAIGGAALVVGALVVAAVIAVQRRRAPLV
ncbi:MFS transporter [Curtobacterium pusillum]|uniref:MFS family permease n=1 Tax=Curtobacterium pusillum TaxID=69373 RepID=A0AAW3T8W7_9MICO|nr:MFS transporter [Curtobacterium pusillum]MBA8990837.1 MFS family permease [Curtobacterium pusillum]NUU14705.1 MFS transporter [Curtobacterium pusillum]GLK31751.1 MFS transporter [Curtobacterium pusillum]